jgi:hypothetical protein
MIFGGVDVGRRNDKTSLCVLDKLRLIELAQLGNTRFSHQSRFLYPRLMCCYETYVDITGLGVGLFEHLQEGHGLPVVPVTIIYGDSLKINDDRSIVVGKQYLVSLINQFLPQITLGVNDAARERLRYELSNFVVVPGRKPRFEARVGHDDLVIALALALLGEVIHVERELQSA